MPYQQYKLSKQELAKMNAGLTDLTLIMQDLERAQQAGVPNIDQLINVCDVCKQRIEALKAAYAPLSK